MKRILTVLFMLLLAAAGAQAQTTITVASLTINATDTLVYIPIMATNLSSAAAISIKIKYKDAAFTWRKAANWGIDSSFALCYAQNGVASISLFSLTPMSISSGKLVDLVFKYNGGSSKLKFDVASCDISNSQGVSMPVTYQNGYVRTPFNGFNLSGLVAYGNSAATPVNGATMYLKDTVSVIDSVVTDTAGHFTFEIIDNGSYTVNGSCSKAWDGVNSTDALQIRRYLAGLSTLDGLNLTAADVNNSGSVNSTDALTIRRRIASLITAFTAPDWIFENPAVVINGANGTQNIKALCTGDVNGSNVPAAK